MIINHGCYHYFCFPSNPSCSLLYNTGCPKKPCYFQWYIFIYTNFNNGLAFLDMQRSGSVNDACLETLSLSLLDMRHDKNINLP